MIHPSAVIDASAKIAEDVDIGAFSVIGANVTIGKGCKIKSHVIIEGETDIGEDNQIYSYAAIGGDPQDLKYKGEITRLEIGNRNRIREYATIHRGTVDDHSLTKIGNDNLLMAYTHVAHDCQLGDHVIMANGVSLAGHVHLDDWAILGGFSMVHQFCKIGAHCFTGISTLITKDIPPYIIANGNPASPRGINKGGLMRREGFNKENVRTIQEAFKILYLREHSLQSAKQQIKKLAETEPLIVPIVTFLEQSTRSIIRGNKSS